MSRALTSEEKDLIKLNMTKVVKYFLDGYKASVEHSALPEKHLIAPERLRVHFAPSNDISDYFQVYDTTSQTLEDFGCVARINRPFSAEVFPSSVYFSVEVPTDAVEVGKVGSLWDNITIKMSNSVQNGFCTQNGYPIILTHDRNETKDVSGKYTTLRVCLYIDFILKRL